MAARALASVTVSFGMVSIPVKLYTATQAQAGVSFNLLHAACGSRLKQQYLCAREGVVVERADMVKGYEFAKDQYVTFTPEELKELEEKGTQTIEISEFVPAESIDPIYYDKAYFLGPDKGGAKPYALLAESMRQTGQTAVGRYAARGKQYIVQLRAVPGGLVMQQLLYAPEVRSLADVGIEEAPVRDNELALAKQLIAQISSDQFDPGAYEDDVKKRIEASETSQAPRVLASVGGCRRRKNVGMLAIPNAATIDSRPLAINRTATTASTHGATALTRSPRRATGTWPLPPSRRSRTRPSAGRLRSTCCCRTGWPAPASPACPRQR
jgi:DNA end-binding protein Ku